MDKVRVLIKSATGAVQLKGDLHISSGIVRIDTELSGGEEKAVAPVWSAVDYLLHMSHKIEEISEAPVQVEDPVKEEAQQSPAEESPASPEPKETTPAEEIQAKITALKIKAKRLTKAEKKQLADLEAELAALESPKSPESDQ
jgi:hypothetical protein